MKFEEIKNRSLSEWEEFGRKDQSTILIGSGTCGRAAGAQEVFSAFQRELDRNSLADKCRIMEVGCLGLCYAEPLVEIRDARGMRILYQKVDAGSVPELVSSHVLKGEPVRAKALAVMEGQALNGIPLFDDLPVIRRQFRIALRNCGLIDPTNIHHYIARGGYSSLARALAMGPEDVIDMVDASLLRGRGGGGFPTGTKWRLCRNAPGETRYLICNGDEGDPGAFMDRSLMEGDPHAIIEGMLIGAWAVGAQEGALYVRGEYPLAIEHLRLAIEQATNAGLLGKRVLDTDFDFDLRLVCNAGAFVSGEETALISSIEGSVAEPRPRPPFPAQSGLYDRPTCINNVETWANVPIIIEKGPEWFKETGVEKNGGTKLFSLAGKVKNTGLIEVPMGTSVRDVVFEIGGGIKEDNPVKAVQTGGPSGGCIPESMLDLPLTYEGLNEAGTIMGSGGMVVMDSETCMVDIARYFLEFTTKESCGKCTPCREGTVNMLAIMERICAGEAAEEDLALLERLAGGVAAASMCGLGKTAPNPVKSTLRYFRDEYLAHIRDRYCPSGVCPQLIPTSCQNACPAGIDVPSYVALIAQGKYEEAVGVIRQDNPFPWVCGLVCPAPCEKECKRGTVDKPVSIRALKAFAAKYVHEKAGGYTTALKTKRDEKVAVIGSGPAGLSAAYYLAVEGYGVTVFEALPKAGGMLRVGIPPHRLPKELLEKEIENISKLGVEIRTNTPLGPDLTLEALFDQGFKSIFLSIGAHRPMALGIKGETAEGVMQGVTYLKRLNLGEPVPEGKKVLVIGGGNVAVDVARSAVRKGAENVTILYRRTREEMPAYESEIEEAIEEGVNITYLGAPAEIIVRDGKVGGVRCMGMELGEPDASGRCRPVRVEGSEYDVEADLVIPAIGQVPETGFLKEIKGLEFNERGDTIQVDPHSFATGIEGVFAGGDVVLGPATVIEAISNGKRAALYMDSFIRGSERPVRPPVPTRKMKVPVVEISEEKMEQLKRPEIPLLPIDKRKTTFEQVDLGLSEDAACNEAQRCLRCDMK
jgi:NADH-quinone oxidoreductase subunit F